VQDKKMKLSKCVLVVLFVIQKVACQVSYQEILNGIGVETTQQLSPQCQQDLNRTTVLTSLYWLMVDSSSRIPSGIARGNVVPMGNYDECLAIEEVPTKFCKAALQFNLPSDVPKLKRINTEAVGVAQKSEAVSIGLYYCVLKSCSTEDLDIIFNGFVKFDDGQCWSSDSGPALDAAAIIAM
jgi:hypothetical protein